MNFTTFHVEVLDSDLSAPASGREDTLYRLLTKHASVELTTGEKPFGTGGPITLISRRTPDIKGRHVLTGMLGLPGIYLSSPALDNKASDTTPDYWKNMPPLPHPPVIPAFPILARQSFTYTLHTMRAMPTILPTQRSEAPSISQSICPGKSL
jgi:hypothetical protein